MVKSLLKVFLLGSAFALAGCAASIPPVEVTRFHLGAPIPVGTVAMEAPLGNSLEQETYDNAVAAELGRLGYPRADISSASYVANVRVRRDTREALARNGSGVSVGIGGATGGYRSGVGLGLGFSFGGKKRDTIVTDLNVQIKRRIGGDVVWEGRAQTEAKENAPAAQPGLAAAKLAGALFKDFPGESGRTISVP